MMIEALESRTLLSISAGVAEIHPVTASAGVIFPGSSSTPVPLAAVVGGALRGRINLALQNQAATVEKGTVILNIYASDNGQFNSSDPLVATVKRQINLAAGASEPLSIAINKVLPTTLAAGTDSLILEAIDPAGNSQVNLAGGTFTYSQPEFLLSEAFGNVPPPALVSATKTNAAVQLQITDNGNIALSGTTTIAVYLSPDQTVASGTLVTTAMRNVTIGRLHTAQVNVPLQSIPALADGSYYIVAKITDSLSEITTIASSTRTVVSQRFVSLSELFAGNSLLASLVSGLSTRAMATLAVKNSGNIVPPAPVTIDLFLSPNPSLSGAVKINTVTKTINVQPGMSKMVKVPLGTLPSLPGGQYYVVAQVTDSTGGISVAATGTKVTVALPIITLTPTFSATPLPASVVSGKPIKDAATLLVKNNGNIPSKGFTVTVLASTTGQVSGATSIATINSKSTIPAGATRQVKIPLSGLASLENASYFLVAEVTDSNGQLNIVKSSSSITVAAPFVTLAATVDSVTTPLLPVQEGIVRFTVTNNGNVAAGDPAGGQIFHIVLDLLGLGGASDALDLDDFTQRLVLAPGQSKKLFAGFSPLSDGNALKAGTYAPRITVSIESTSITANVTGTTLPITVEG